MQEAPPVHPHGSVFFDCPQDRVLTPTWQGLGLPGHPLRGAWSVEPASCLGHVRLRNDVRCVSGLLGLPRAPGSGMPGPRVTSQSGATERPAASGPSGGTQLLRVRHVPLKAAGPARGSGQAHGAPASVPLLGHRPCGDLSSAWPGRQLSSARSALGSTWMCCSPGFGEFFFF